MTMKLIPLKLLTDGQNTISLMVGKKEKPNILWLARSIFKDGLLNPLVVIKQGSKYVVLDGKKRLAIIRKLAKSKRLSKRIAKVPCVVQETQSISPINRRRPILLTGPELAHQVIIAAQSGESPVSIAQRFDCCSSVIEDCLSLQTLHPEILIHFNKKALSLEQVAAFATIENMTAQLDLLHQLGPFVSNTDIIQAIRGGATVLELPHDDIIFLPSRERPKSKKKQNIIEFGKSGTPAARREIPIAA